MSSPTADEVVASPHHTMGSFAGAPGSTVVIRDEEWLVTSVEPTTDGHFVHVVGLSELVRETEATFSTALDTITVADPRRATVVADNSPRYRQSRLWLEAMLRKTHVPIADTSLTVAHRALADPLPYQFAAARQALDPDNLRPRILLADAVGLGKTLEIGMILSELARRGRGDRILIVTPKHVLEQMQFELWTRFALPFVRLDSTGIQRIRQQIPANRNPFSYFKRVIISIDTLKSDRYHAHLRKHSWDAVVIDESHNVTNPATQNFRLASLLAQNTDALILASATPHNGQKESFAELIRMLEPSAVRPDGELDENQVRRLIVRRHRHSPDVASVVGSDWAERKEPQNVLVEPSEIEEEIARELESTWLWPASGRSPYSGSSGSRLFPWTLAKAFLSSPAALLESVDNRLRAVARRDSDEDGTAAPGGDDRLLDEAVPAPKGESAALSRLRDLAERSLSEPSAKYDALLNHLIGIGVGRGRDERAVIFAERVATLGWLQQHLMNDLDLSEDEVRVLHGGLTDVEQQEIVESFKLASSPIRVLVTGDVASEGVNFHSQCHHLIHYDIPWSLIRIEQRNGRIDRYGQQHPPQITTLLLDPRTTEKFGGDLRVLTRLVDREHQAHKALGDTASLMGKYDVDREEDAIRDVLRRRKQLGDVVAEVEDIATDEGPAGLLARLMNLGTSQSGSTADNSPRSDGTVPTSVVYDDELAYLEDALHQIYKTPGQPPTNGVSWRSAAHDSIASLQPPKDLQQRLDVLPQSYLTDRRVKEVLRLATSVERGRQELAQARSAESASAWPQAHYLAPLHPVIDWVSDRALSDLGRNQVFAVRGEVEDTTVLVQATFTNTRGQVVAISYITVAFPNPSFGMAEPQSSAADALATLGVRAQNSGPVPDPESLEPVVARAIDAAEAVAEEQAGAIKEEASTRVQAWLERTARWRHEADALFDVEQGAARGRLKRRAAGVTEEAELARAMEAERTLLRPLLVAVPAHEESPQGGKRNGDE